MKKETENRKKPVTVEELQAKYHDAKVMVVDASVVSPFLKDGFTCRKDAMIPRNNVVYPLRSVIAHQMYSAFRAEVELDFSKKQIVMYAILMAKDGRIFTTHRLGGDSRLVNMYSVGTGGHVDGGEGIYDALYRELQEEVGLVREDNPFTSFFNGYISCSKTEVDKVHLGLVFTVVVDHPEKIVCLEKDKLSGEWLTVKELKSLYDSGKLETWSEIAYAEVIQHGEV